MSDFRLIAVIGIAHFASHFFQLTLPPLFPLLRAEFDVGYAALGLVMSVFYGASAVGQSISGFLVDRAGARPVLLGGTAALAGGITLTGFVDSMSALVAVALVAGLGNSVFHPADYALFNTTIGPSRLGRAYSAHALAGALGYAAAPATIVALAAAFGWRAAVIGAGLTGLGWLAVLAYQTRGLAVAGAEPARRTPEGGRASASVLFTTPIIAAFAYFALLTTATAGTQTFSVAAIVALYASPLGIATTALSGYLIGKAAGMLGGGLLADRTSRHDMIAAGGILVAAALVLVVASGAVPLMVVAAAMTLAGAALGLAQPSRDLLIRAVTPPGASGRVFGFAYSGMDIGSALTPVVFGWLLDHGQPRALFVVVATLMVLTIGTVIAVSGGARRTRVAVGGQRA